MNRNSVTASRASRLTRFLGFAVLASLTLCSCGYASQPSASAAAAPPAGPASTFDVVVYGGTPSGIMAAIQAARLGKRVALVEPTPWVGGMITGGLSETDSGTWTVIGGLALEFFKNTTALEAPRKGSPTQLNGIIFNVEPHIAAQVFTSMLQQAGVTVHRSAPLAAVQMNGTRIAQIRLADGSSYLGQVYIDSSYEGDLMALAGVPYAVGREAASTIEPDAGVQLPVPVLGAIDPYVEAGNPGSGLLFEVSDGPVQPLGSADEHVMAYGYRLCVTDVAAHGANAIPFSQFAPPNYSESMYAGVQRIIDSQISHLSGEQTARLFFSPAYYRDAATKRDVYLPYAEGKFDINGLDAYSSDVVKSPDLYPDGDWTTRGEVAAQIRRYDQGLLHFLATGSKVPASVRDFVRQFGICKDEFADNGNFPTQLYVREGRRMHGAYVMTEADVLGKVAPAPADVVAMGGYNMDSHIHQLLNIDDRLYQEGSTTANLGYGCASIDNCLIVPGTPFPIPYRALTPAAADATNLLVSVTMSASGTAYRAIRLEPQYMMMGQAAGAAAAIAIDDRVPVQGVPYAQLQRALITPTHTGQPPQVLTPVKASCVLKAEIFSSGSSVTAFEAIPNTQTCTAATFVCSNGTWLNGSDLSPIPYYPSCPAALAK